MFSKEIFGQRLKEIRMDHNETQTDLALLLGVKMHPLPRVRRLPPGSHRRPGAPVERRIICWTLPCPRMGERLFSGRFAACSFLAFPLGGRCPRRGRMRGQFKEQASLEEYRRAGACPRRLFIQRPQGEFRRLRAASDFLDGQKVTKKPLGGGRNRQVRQSLPASMSPSP